LEPRWLGGKKGGNVGSVMKGRGKGQKYQEISKVFHERGGNKKPGEIKKPVITRGGILASGGPRRMSRGKDEKKGVLNGKRKTPVDELGIKIKKNIEKGGGEKRERRFQPSSQRVETRNTLKFTDKTRS